MIYKEWQREKGDRDTEANTVTATDTDKQIPIINSVYRNVYVINPLETRPLMCCCRYTLQIASKRLYVNMSVCVTLVSGIQTLPLLWQDCQQHLTIALQGDQRLSIRYQTAVVQISRPGYKSQLGNMITGRGRCAYCSVCSFISDIGSKRIFFLDITVIDLCLYCDIRKYLIKK